MIRIFVFLTLSLVPGIIYSQNRDIDLLRSIYTPESLPSDKLFKFISDSHFFIVAGVPVSMGTAGFIRHDDKMKNKSVEIIAGCVINFGLTSALKYSIKRERPYITYPDIVKKTGALSPSFPSGHTSASFELATSLSLAFPKWYIIVPSFIWAGTVGYSRIHLGVHYPSDVVAGAILGSATAWITYEVSKKL